MHRQLIAALPATAKLAAACRTAPGSTDWCKGVIDGSVKTPPEEVVSNAENCTASELAG